MGKKKSGLATSIARGAKSVKRKVPFRYFLAFMDDGLSMVGLRPLTTVGFQKHMQRHFAGIAQRRKGQRRRKGDSGPTLSLPWAPNGLRGMDDPSKDAVRQGFVDHLVVSIRATADKVDLGDDWLQSLEVENDQADTFVPPEGCPPRVYLLETWDAEKELWDEVDPIFEMWFDGPVARRNEEADEGESAIPHWNCRMRVSWPARWPDTDSTVIYDGPGDPVNNLDHDQFKQLIAELVEDEDVLFDLYCAAWNEEQYREQEVGEAGKKSCDAYGGHTTTETS